MTEKPQKEGMQAQAAFMQYLALGPTRSLAKVSAALGKPPGYTRRLQTWSSAFSWVERAKEHDAGVMKEEIAEADAERKEAKRRHAQIGREQQEKAIAQISALMDAEAFGSIAAVQLLKLAIDVERAALDLDKKPDFKQEITSKEDGTVKITTTWGGGQLEDEKE